jgi:hypothetical protein
MDTVKICIYDREENYANRLAAFIGRQGEGRYKVSAFTNPELFLETMANRKFNILVGTNVELLEYAKQCQKDMQILWLKEGEEECTSGYSVHESAMVSKYAGAKMISNMVEKAAAKIMQMSVTARPVVAMYSPVGRCGKTGFALDLLGEEGENGWLYVGLEDYGCVGNQRENDREFEWQDSFLYFVKERDREKLSELVEESGGVIPSAFSPFDIKEIEKEDWEWLLELFRQQTQYVGTIFDIGTGVLKRAEFLAFFDTILVPYIQENTALLKMRKFENLLKVFGMTELLEKMICLDMGNPQEVLRRKEEMRYGKG